MYQTLPAATFTTHAQLNYSKVVQFKKLIMTCSKKIKKNHMHAMHTHFPVFQLSFYE